MSEAKKDCETIVQKAYATISWDIPQMGASAQTYDVVNTALGKIDAQLTFSSKVYAVVLKCYLSLESAIPLPPPSSAVPGASTDNLVWTWKRSNPTPNPIPGVDHAPSSSETEPTNYLVVWFRASLIGPFETPQSIYFKGKE